MPPTGSNFIDWQQQEKESLLFVDSDFNWSEPPPTRRRITHSATRTRRAAEDEPIRVARRVAVIDYEPEYALDSYGSYADEPLATSPGEQDEPLATSPVEQTWEQPTEAHSHFDEMMAEWHANYGVGRDLEDVPAERSFDLSDPGAGAPGSSERRTVMITGHGDERYLPAPRARRSSELRFHERDGFSPDRFGLWAVLLAIALVLVAVVH